MVLLAMACESNPKHNEVVTKPGVNKIGLEWSELSVYLSERVPAYMIPKKGIALQNLPLHVSKKLDRSKTAAWRANLSDEQKSVDGPTSNERSLLTADETIALEISRKVADLVSKGSISEHQTIQGHDARLSTIGMDSVRMASLAAFIKRFFGVVIPMHKLISNQTTIRDISRHIFDAKTGVEPQGILNSILWKRFGC